MILPAVRYIPRTVFDLSNAGTASSNHIRGMDVCRRFSVFVLSYIGRGLAMVRSPIKGVLPHIKIIFSEANSELEQARRPNV
jgi:hypothetical protein